MYILVLLAGGQSLRARPTPQSLPKQLCQIGGITPLELCMRKFIAAGIAAHNIYVVFNEEFQQEIKKIIEPYPAANLVPGGKTRQLSVKNALMVASEANPTQVLIHDVARPFVSIELIKQVITGLKTHDAVDVALPVVDHLKDKNTLQSVDRTQVYATQTPQGFIFAKILEAHNRAPHVNFTDDISLYLTYFDDVLVVEGESNNTKITTKEDLMVHNKLHPLPRLKVGYGIDFHRFGKEGKTTIRIGGVDVPASRQIVAHSDGDVVLHAVVDALLGALGLGDIGEHFPDTDMKYKDYDSTEFVKHTIAQCKEQMAEIMNMDITILCEMPRISQYREAMRIKIAELLDISKNDVNIKATTTEKMGALGRSEGIAAQACCLLNFKA